MSSNWEIKPLGELVSFYSGGTPSKKNSSYWGGNIPWISAKTMKSERISTSDLMITDEGLAAGSRLAPKGSLLLLTRGSGLFNGIPLCIVESPVAFNQDVKCLEAKADADIMFIFYWLKSQEAYLKAKLEVTGIGAGKFDTKFLAELPIAVPDRETQYRIISIADAISEKIIVNQKINDNLQQQTNTLFNQMFGDDNDTIELGSVIITTSGGTPSRKHPELYENATIPWVKSKELAGGFIHETEEHINHDALKASAAKLLPAHSVLVAMYGATVGEHGIISIPMACNQAVCALLQNDNYPYPYLFELLRHSKDNLKNMAVGSAQQNISQVMIKQLPVHRSVQKTVEFSDTVRASFDMIESLSQENMHLVSIRDTLLPKLMSGEIDISAVQP